MIQNPLHRVRMVLVYFLAILILGTVGYRLLTPLGWLDSLYFTVTTIATVGFRELAELDAAGKIFTMLLIFGGAGLLAYTFTTVVEITLDEHTRTYFQLMYNLRRTRLIHDHFIVCGLGRVGVAVCEELAASGTPFLIVDSDTKRLQYASSRGWLSVLGDATEDRVLEQASIQRAKGLITCVDTDTTNLFVVVSAKGLNPDLEISARVGDENNLNKFKRAGAAHVYSPYSLVGRRIARSATRPRVLELLDLALEQTNYDLTIEECALSETSPMTGVKLKDSGIRQQFGGVVLSIIRADHEILHNPDPDTLCQAGDILITLGTPEQLRKMREIATGSKV